MIEPIEMILAASFGSLIAIFYFGGLWWTVRRLPVSRHPVAMYFGSLASRLTIALLGFCFLVLYCPWQLPIACLFGFIVTRFAFIQFIGREHLSEAAVERVRR